MPGQLFGKVIIHHCVRYLGPAVQHVPPDYAGALPLQAAGALDEELQRLGLGYLRNQRKFIHAFRLVSAQKLHLIGHELVARVERILDAHVLGGMDGPRQVVPGPQIFRRDKSAD